MEEKEKNNSTDETITSESSQQESGDGKDYSKYSIEEVKEEAVKVLKTVFDPEIPVNIYALGLIYDIMVATNKDVLVVMTLTSPSCPVAGTLPGEVEQKLKEHPMIHDAKVELTFDPPWNQKMMSEEAKLELGFL